MLQFDSPATWGDALGDSGLPATREQLLLQLCQAFGNVNSDAFHVVFHERSWISIIIATIAIITRFFSRVIVIRLLYSLYYLYLARILIDYLQLLSLGRVASAASRDATNAAALLARC
jgi:hypothetical protein